MQQMAGGFDAAIGKIIQTVSSASSELELSAGRLTKTAEVTQTLSATVAAASEQSSANAQSAAAAAEEMTSSVSEISRQVQDLHKISREAVSQVEQTNARIADLSQSASRIGEVVRMITAVAEQTNLLALNATIEAARAGEARTRICGGRVRGQGARRRRPRKQRGNSRPDRGDAVRDPAARCRRSRKLAARSAARGNWHDDRRRGRGAGRRDAGDLATSSKRRKEPLRWLRSITDVNRGATETGAASTHVHGLAQSLLGQSNHLKGEVAKFLSTVRAA